METQPAQPASRKQHLLDLYKLVEAAYDERAIVKHDTGDKVTFTLSFDHLKSSFALAVSSRP